jgi:splicing factor 45
MSKYGWQKGSGLGATSSGIVNPLRVQVEKRRRKADADGGGWAEPGGRGKIVGGHTKRKGDGEQDSPGDMSEVIVLHHMLDNMPDLAAEIEDGLGQEIGQECGEKVGFKSPPFENASCQKRKRREANLTNSMVALNAYSLIHLHDASL